MKETRFLFLPILFVLTLYPSSFAQGICPISTLRIDRVRGKVLWNDKNAEPITKTKVELKRLDEEQSLVTSTLTDDAGFFEINVID
jgi:hypothetical protein